MKQKLFIALSVTFLSLVIIWACKDEELPEFSGINKVELTIIADTTSYVFSEINCTLNPKPAFTVEQHGFCWDTIANVTIEKQKSNNGTLNSQNFDETIENLLPNKTYYVKAYLQNQEAIIYSNELTINTLDARPIVTTNDISNILANSAQSGGTANSYEALFPITQRGVCWAKTQNPTIADSLTLNGTGIGAFISQLPNLGIGENYFVRAYAINSQGITYGNKKTFSTLDGIPDLTTDSIKNITATSATFYGNIIENDGLAILEKGFCWGITTNPTITNSFQIVTSNNLGNFNTAITGLAVNTTFYVKAYLKNAKGTFYGNQLSFTTENGLPKVTTSAISNITAISASSGGNITDDGGFTIIARGVCWGTNENSTIADSHTSDGTGTGNYISNLTGLLANTTYYIRAYTTNATGTGYGNQLSFTTDDGIPSLTTTSISNITAISASSGGNITDDGGAQITERGICWSTSQNPTLSNNYISNGSGTGSFTAALTGLNPNTTYYVKAYTKNVIGTNYGNEINFTTDDGIPSITTTNITIITATSASSGGEITDNGGLAITARGVCWNTSANPTITDNKTDNGTGTGSFTSNLTELAVNTNYYVRAYATNSAGTTYGNEQIFTTKTGLPTLSTNDVTAITYNSATSGGIITDDGGASITARGICWSANPNPTISNNHITEGNDTGSFLISIAGLAAWTKYYVRSFAENSLGTHYGNEIVFTTIGSITDYDGNIYETVKIGNQVWIAENLKTTHYANGVQINLVDNSASWDALVDTDKAMCYYANSVTNKNTYGALYTWAAAVNSASGSSTNPSGIQGACPDGWHLPSDEEWKELEIFLGMSEEDADILGLEGQRGTNEGSKLAGNEYLWMNGILENDTSFGYSGFMALPGGFRYYNGVFYLLGENTYFWSATEGSISSAWYRTLDYESSGVRRWDSYKVYGISIRCVKD